MVGRNPGLVTTQGERLSELLADAGYPVVSVSGRANRYARAVEIAFTLASRRHDIVVLQVFSGGSFAVTDAASRIAAARALPTIMVLRGGNLPMFFERHPIWARRVLARADALVAPSAYLARTVAALGFACETIPNVIDIARYPCRHRARCSPTLIWMRAFHPFYNPELAVRVVARLRRVEPQATLVMAGVDKGFEWRTKEFARQLGVADAVRFAGFLDMAGKIREMSSADIYLHTNSIDNTPVSVLEAAALGLPVVATRVGGIPDLLTDEETALVVPPDDEVAMSDAVLRLIREPAVAGRLSANGRVLAESCSIDGVLPRWKALVDSIVHRR
jgi:glycosyltransferase involved in cell wall biosynthesis